MLHISTQKEYISWIEMVIANPFSALPPFCDWLDENNISSQQWREIFANLDKVLYTQTIINKRNKTIFVLEDFAVTLPSGQTNTRKQKVAKLVTINTLQCVRMITKQNLITISLSGAKNRIDVHITNRPKFMTHDWLIKCKCKYKENKPEVVDLTKLIQI